MAAGRNPNVPRSVTPLTLEDIVENMKVVVHFRVLRPHQEELTILKMHNGSPDSGPWVEVRSSTGRQRSIFLTDVGVCAFPRGAWSVNYVVRAEG